MKQIPAGAESRQNYQFYDLSPGTSEMKEEVLIGLSQPQKWISPKYLYDEQGSRIFEEICDLQDYYLTRAERSIFEMHAKEMASLMGEGIILIEPGAGNATKARFLLRHLESPEAYVPIEISRETLVANARRLAEDHPGLRVVPVCADYTQGFVLPPSIGSRAKRVGFFPGSTIGNFDPVDASAFLRGLASTLKAGGGLLIGVDMKKDRRTLERAYADSEGVTARFNLNLLTRLNRELDSTFDPGKFRHRAIYDEKRGRIEMHLVSECAQTVRVAEEPIHFHAGETVHTESSYKYSISEFKALASLSDFELKRCWTDSQERFAVYYFERGEANGRVSGSSRARLTFS